MSKRRKDSHPGKNAPEYRDNPAPPIQKTESPLDPNDEKNQRRHKNLGSEEKHRWPKR